MTGLYIALAQVLASLIVSKIQKDATVFSERQKLADAAAALWKKVNDAHITIQTGVPNDKP